MRLLPLILAACTAPEQTLSAHGYLDITLEMPGQVESTIDAVTVGGVPAYDIHVDNESLTVTVQGGEPGDAEVLIRVGEQESTVGTVVYAEPVDPVFDRMFAIGASYTMGFQDGAPTQRAQLNGFARLLAQAAGAYLPLPLFRADLFTPLDVDVVGPPPGCAVGNTTVQVGLGIVSTYNSVLSQGSLAGARVTPSLEPRNVAVANAKLPQIVHGTDPQDAGIAMLEGLALSPDLTAYGDPLGPTQLDRLVAADPTLVLALDVAGNQLMSLALDGDFDPAEAPTVDELLADLRIFLDRSTANGAQVFLGSVPPAQMLPGVTSRATDEELSSFMDTAARYDAAFRDLVDTYDTAHFVDLGKLVDRVGDGVTYDGEWVDMTPLGGATSLDGGHLADVGQAELANLFADAIEDALGVSVPRVDVDAIFAASPHHPDVFRSKGRDPDACR